MSHNPNKLNTKRWTLDLDESKLSLLFYPVFDNEIEFTDHYYRLIWYLNPLLSSIEKVLLPIRKGLVVGDFPIYLDPKIKGFEKNLHSRIQIIEVENEEELLHLINPNQLLLLWKIDKTDGDWYKDGPLKSILKSMKIYRIDHDRERYSGSFYLRVSMDYNDEEETIRECKDKFQKLKEKLSFVKEGYIFGTGPSLKFAMGHDFSGGTPIACNSMVKNRELMEKLKPPIIVCSDPIFHAGCSSYAGEFRKYLEESMHIYDSYLIVPMRDYQIYIHNLDHSLRDKVIGIPYQNGDVPNLNLNDHFFVTTTSNVLTLFLLPLASTFFNYIKIMGCDGRPIEQNQYFWKHDPESQFVSKMGDIQLAHPAFFKIDYDEYYIKHCETLEKWLNHLENHSKIVLNLTPSYIPALSARQI